VWFRNPKSRVSAHYVVSRKAEMVCMVRPEDKAWHVNNFNNRAIGIEIEDYDSATKEHCKTLPIWWTDVQLKAVAELCIALMKEFKITSEHIIGHNNPMLRVYGNTHVDPKNFPWEKFRALIKEIQDEGSKN
jgi:N-acetylmuramoyl-L-alanine amidase